jgi:hypothetical protein
LLDKAVTANRQRKEAEGQCEHLVEELTLLRLRGSKLCLTIARTLPQDPLHAGKWFAAAHYTGVAIRLFCSRWQCVRPLSLCLGAWPLKSSRWMSWGEMVVKFWEQVEQCSCLKTFGLRICDLILGLADEWVHLTIRLEEATG